MQHELNENLKSLHYDMRPFRCDFLDLDTKLFFYQYTTEIYFARLNTVFIDWLNGPAPNMQTSYISYRSSVKKNALKRKVKKIQRSWKASS